MGTKKKRCQKAIK